MNDLKHIKQFISTIVDKNYSKSNEHLQKMIEVKLANRIKASLENKN